MIIIGEKINATRKAIAAALEARDAEHIVRTAREQAEAGADYVDVNGGDARSGREVENMAWLMDVVQATTDLPVAVDSADPAAARLGLKTAKRKPILNSISLESDRLAEGLAVAGEFDCMVVGLLMSDAGTPCGVDDRMANTRTLVEGLTGAGKKVDEIIIDPCFLPVSADAASGRAIVDAIAAIRREWPEIHIAGGLSNISYGLPQRRWVNLAALAACIFAGMDTAIVNPCAEGTMSMIHAAEAVAGRDEFCMNYVTKMR